jgi:tRNA-(ms[2]io[6]A)-hydroxylase
MSTADQRILGLQLPTDPRWTNLAELSLEYILTDHAYCEMKAATQCISIIQAYPEKQALVKALAPIVTEEWGHFRLVVQELYKRGYELGPQRKDDYVNALMKNKPSYHNKSMALLHKLTLCALIEARSCERFRLLSEGLQDDKLRKFYYQFMVSEAGHYRLFIDLAKLYFDEHSVEQSWKHWLDTEARILLTLPIRGDRMH